MNPDSEMQDNDDPLRRTLAALPMPATPPSIVERTVRHARHRRSVFRLSAVAALLLVALLLSLLPSDRASNELAGKTVTPTPNVLDARTLENLFAPPPVESLAILDHRLEATFRVVNSMETTR